MLISRSDDVPVFYWGTGAAEHTCRPSASIHGPVVSYDSSKQSGGSFDQHSGTRATLVRR